LTSPDAVVAILKTVPDFQIEVEGDTSGNAVIARIGSDGPTYTVVWRAWAIAADAGTSILDTALFADMSKALPEN
jgi:hypothetical protein